ncbi:MAG: hypothetical protein ACLTDV_11750 [Eubacterium sp.]
MVLKAPAIGQRPDGGGAVRGDLTPVMGGYGSECPMGCFTLKQLPPNRNYLFSTGAK